MASTLDAKWAFFEGKIVPIEEANVNMRSCILQYGTGVFEGIRAYWNEEQKKKYIFRAKEHFLRLKDNAKLLLMDIKYSTEELTNIAIELLKRENYQTTTYIRPLAYYSSIDLREKLNSDQYDVSIFTYPMGDIFNLNGINICISSWLRCSDNMIPPRGKIIGNYVNISLILYDAKKSGYDDALIMTIDGHVSEGAGQNFVMVRKNKLVSPPVTDEILEGITLDSVTDIAKNELGMDIERRSIDRTELYQAEEIFYCGTGAQITPVLTVDHRKIADGEPGSYTKQIQKMYFDIVKGKNSKYSEWLTEVK